MPTVRWVQPVGVWWLRLLMVAIAAFFGWVEWVGLHSKSPMAHPYILLPLYGILLYWTLAAVLNRQVKVGEVFEPKQDPLTKLQTWYWTGICVTAFAFGLIWEYLIPR